MSLVVPTKDRPDFVGRLLEYYATVNFSGTILVGDSSSKEKNATDTQRAVDFWKDKINARYEFLPGLTNYAVTSILLADVSTPFSAYLPDDDFLTDVGITAGVNFLQENPDYVTAWGDSLIFKIDRSGPYGAIAGAQQSNWPTSTSYASSTGIERLKEHQERYSSVFIGVTRTDALRSAVRNAVFLSEENSKIDSRNHELMLCCELLTSYSLVAQGKVGHVDCLHWVRHEHDARFIDAQTDFVGAPIFSRWYRVALEQITEDIVRTDGIDESVAKEAVLLLLCKYWNFYTLRLQKNVSIAYVFYVRTIRQLERIRPLRQVVWLVKDFFHEFSKNNNPYSKLNLQKSSSKYFKEFNPIARIVSRN